MADELTENSSRRRRHRRQKKAQELARPAALCVFALLITLGPLVFGSVDRIVQISLTALLGVGMLLVPPRILSLPSWLNRVLIVFVAIMVIKELAPAGLFGKVAWRETLVGAYGLDLGWMHHPEAGRAVDGWLAGAIGLGFVAWVRTLAMEREDRTRLAWIMLISAAIVAAISFATAKGGPTGDITTQKMIYGLRYTQGYFGFGPFPNRNHSACYFAMAALIGAGCLARSGERKHFGLLATAGVMLALILFALLRTQSRGGIVALGVGMAIFLGVVLLKLRSRQALAVTIAVGLLVGGLGLLAGGKTLKRFAGTGLPTDDSAAARVEVWKNATVMWRDAPMFGHGLGVFASVFPMYQNMEMEEVRVKHPESSVLQWLNELGLVPVMLAAIALLAFSLPHFGSLFERRSSFFIRAAAFGAAAGLLAHAVIDVPAHRWGTLGFALAALALACPAAAEARSAPRRSAIMPLGIAAFWLMPLWFEKPAWSTFQLDREIASLSIPPGPPLSEIDVMLRGFPLNPQLHFARGERLLKTGALPPSRWQNELRIATRLVPNSWEICARSARLCRSVQPSLAMHYWQLAIERATRQRVDIFGRAVKDTAGFPGAADIWSAYAETHPDLALLFSEGLPDDAGRHYYDLWWRQRGSQATDISEAEAAAFVRVAARWGSAEQLASWMERHPKRSKEDFRGWAYLLHAWGSDDKAWEILQREMPEPVFPTGQFRQKREELGFLWRHNPEDIVNARNYAQLLNEADEREESEKVILAVAVRADAPKWFLEKAAHQLAKKKDFAKAVELALRQPALTTKE